MKVMSRSLGGEMNMKYCTYCGKAIEDQNLYCPYCGKKVPDMNKRVESQPIQPQAQTNQPNASQPQMANSSLAENEYVQKAEGYVKNWAKPAILSIASMIYGGVLAVFVFFLLIQANSVSNGSSDIDSGGVKGLVRMFPSFYWLAIIAGIALLALAIYRYVQVKNEKVNLIYAVAYGVDVLLVHNLKDLKELASSINRSSYGGIFSYGLSTYSSLSEYKTTFIFLLIVSAFICFAGYAVRRQMQNKSKISPYFDVYDD